jgi:hypothetical protein
MGIREIVVALSALTLFFFRRELLDAFREGINNFRGGPPTPRHPLPADDGTLLRRRSRKSDN